MLLRTIARSSFAKVKPLKIHGQTEGNEIHFVADSNNYKINIDNPLEALIGSLAACELNTLKAISRASNLKIKNVKFTRVESGINLEKFMKGGPEDKIQDVTIEAEIETNVNQQELDQWMKKALNSCPVYQMFKSAGVKVESKWTNVQTLP